MNGLNNFDKTYREYSSSLTDDLIRFWGSDIKVIVGYLLLLLVYYSLVPNFQVTYHDLICMSSFSAMSSNICYYTER